MLIAVAIGWREAVVTLVVIPTTILLTLFAAKLMGYTINRVSLFALIFAIGILVDDAIVVVENIARHWAMRDGRSRMQAAIEAVAEVGNPTVVATLTVIAALLPMLFVSGLMGPYMAPIPANASAAMLFSFFVAMVVAPWLMLPAAPRAIRPGAAARLPRKRNLSRSSPGIDHDLAAHHEGRLGRIYRAVAAPLLRTRARAWIFLIGRRRRHGRRLRAVLHRDRDGQAAALRQQVRTGGGAQPAGGQQPGGYRARAVRRRAILRARCRSCARCRPMPAPRRRSTSTAWCGITTCASRRNWATCRSTWRTRRSGSAAATPSRSTCVSGCAALQLPEGSTLQVVEVPPGPPVLATLLAEIYGPDAQTRRAVAEEVKKLFQVRAVTSSTSTDSYGHPRPRLRISIDQDELEYFGVEQSDVYDTIQALFGGVPVGYSHRGEERDPIEIRIGLPKRDLSWDASAGLDAGAGQHAARQQDRGRTRPGRARRRRSSARRCCSVATGISPTWSWANWPAPIEAPIYGMLAVDEAIAAHDWGKLPKPDISLRGQPADESHPTLLWDGEWEITYVTFRDMGAAFGVAMLGIYILVVAQFRSFKLPLVILTPIPLTLIGIVLGHWLFHAPFTATSMIGFIALAGIIVRNSILLVDFIRHGADRRTQTLRDVLLDAGAIRFKPILLTALSAMIGAATILTDPIFQGLAISLLFGLASSTLLTVLVIPAIYVVLRDAESTAA